MTQKPASTDIQYTPTSCWDVYTDEKDTKAMLKLAERYRDFLTRCKTERETIDYVTARLAEHGFLEGSDDASMVCAFRQKALFAARKGSLPLSKGVHLISAHTDTPRLDFKQRPFIEQPGVAQAKTHYYGGIRKYQWLARPLALHGVVMRADGTKVSIVIGEEADEPVFTIADLLPHLAQKHVTQTVSDAFEAEKLNIILGHSPVAHSSLTGAENPVAKKKKGKDKKEDFQGRTAEKGAERPKDALKAHVLKLLHEKYQITEEDFICAEMQAVPAGAARFVGLDAALIGGYGHDDRICVFTALEAFLTAKNPQHTMVLMLWDKEEIGSDGATGASSRFLQYCLEDCCEKWDADVKLRHMLLESKAISADVQAALDPDWQEVHEKQNAAQLGYGPCFSKFTGSRGKYGANDADAELVGWMRALCRAHNIPWQMAECGKVDLGGGGTVALFLATYGMHVIDCGPAVLSMHSPFELASCADIFATTALYKAFFEAK